MCAADCSFLSDPVRRLCLRSGRLVDIAIRERSIAMAGRHLSLCAALTAGMLGQGCAHHAPEPYASNREVVDVAGEHPHLNRASSFCTQHEVLCILAGIAVFGGTVAALQD